MTEYDIIIIGGGMAGASLGAEVASHARTLILEMEDVLGYHATGRSVAFWTESYGGPGVQPLTSASGSLLANPDPGFSDTGFLTPRGALHVARSGSSASVETFLRRFADTNVPLQRVDRVGIAEQIPGLRADWTLGVFEATTADIDVAALHAAYLRQFAKHGGAIRTGAKLTAARCDIRGWQVDTTAGTFRCTTLVNAAGAWADHVAAICGVPFLGIKPLQRTVVQLRLEAEIAAALPLVLDLKERFYFKPAGGGRLWLSPHDETPATPGDAAADEIAVATAIDRLHQVVDWKIVAVERKWAGLRSFAPDRLPVYGRDVHNPDFFWFAGQGGFGIQTAPAAARIGAALLLGQAMDARLSAVDIDRYSPMRFDIRESQEVAQKRS